MRRSVCFWYRIYGTQVPEFTSQPTVFWYFSGNSMEFQNGTGIPKTVQSYSKATAPCASSKLYNKTCPIPDLETDSNSSVMLFSGKHIHNKICRPVASSGHQTKTHAQYQRPNSNFESKTQPKSGQTAGRHFCGRHALALIKLFAHVTSSAARSTRDQGPNIVWG